MRSFGVSVAVVLGLLSCSSGNNGRPDGGAQIDGGAQLDTVADQLVDSSVAASRPPVYGIFQLYGDEYFDFRQKMGWSLEQYWEFVDEHVAALGVRFTRTNTLLIWGKVEPTLGGGFDWENDRHTDRVIAATFAPAAGKEMGFLAVIEPSRGVRGDPPFPTGIEAQYQDYVRAVVERYDGDSDEVGPHVAVEQWQVMNEPRFALQGGLMTPEQYAELVKLTATAARQTDPEAKIVLGDLGSAFPEVIAALKDGDYFDAVDIHFWCATDPCAYEWPNVAKVRQGLDANGYPQAEIWMAEFGTWVNSAEGLVLHTAEDQARWLVKAMVANRAAGVSLFLWNNLVPFTNYAGDPNSVYNFMGLLTNGPTSADGVGDVGNERVSYHAYRRLIAETGSQAAELVAEQSLSTSGARAFLFKRRTDGENFTIAWADEGAKTIELPCAGTEAMVTDLVPSATGEFKATPKACSGSKVQVDVGDNPMLVVAQPR